MNKNALLLVSVVFYLQGANAQVCGEPSAQADIHANNIRARLLTGGDMFWDLRESMYFPGYVSGQDNPSTIFLAGLWIGGIGPDTTLKLATVDYRTDGNAEFWPGPLNTDGTTNADACAQWDRFFRGRAQDVDAFLTALPDLAGNPPQAMTQFPDIMGWPGRGNPYFALVNGFTLPDQSLAPFVDSDNNGLYDPLVGDYPCMRLEDKDSFVPTEFYWWVYNDEGAGSAHYNSWGEPLQVEVQQMAWGFSCPGPTPINNTLFTTHRVILKSDAALDSTYMAIWTDFDIGCQHDDYPGTVPELNTFYAYNRDTIDGDLNNFCPPAGDNNSFPGNAPVQSATYLNRTLSSVFGFQSGGGPGQSPNGPTGPIAFYQALSGNFSGQPSEFIFPDDPADPDGWSACSANPPEGDWRVLPSTKIGRLEPGVPVELHTAWITHFNPPLPCNLGSMRDNIQAVQAIFDNGFQDVCQVVATLNPEINDWQLFPNPATDKLTLVFEQIVVREIRALAADGRCMQRLAPLPGAVRAALDTRTWAPGLYTIQLVSGSEILTKKVIVQR
ncbi:MAG: hypothetical protein SFV52_04055 [Saprospiraceae bacterium]|nr:hypothetical protein [Saprospiraceae bacterium]